MMYAHPATSSSSDQGPLGLPLFEQTVVSGVDPGSFERIDPPTPSGTGVRAGDVLSFPRSWETPGLGWVESHTGGGVRVTWPSRDESPTTYEEPTLDTALEYGRVEKVASDLTREELRYLLTGEWSDDTGRTAESGPSSHRSLSTSDLTLTRERDWDTVRRFVNHPEVGHDLGVNFPQKKAAFGARVGGPDGDIAAIVVLTYPTARKLDGTEMIELKRYASHPNRPPNTASWLISRACRWAELEGYERLRTYAGVADNEGTIYQALGFDPLDDSPVETDGSGWTDRGSEGQRSEWDDYEKRRYECQLAPSVPKVTRRGPRPEADRDSETRGLEAFGAVPDAGVVADAKAVDNRSQSDDRLAFGRRDQRPDDVVEVFEELEDQIETDESIEQVGDEAVTFAALAPEGVVAALVATVDETAASHTADVRTDGGVASVSPAGDGNDTVPAHGRGQSPHVHVVGYAAQDTAYPHNLATTLLARLREWAGLEGYREVVATAREGTILERALQQSGLV